MSTRRSGPAVLSAPRHRPRRRRQALSLTDAGVLFLVTLGAVLVLATWATETIARLIVG